MYGCANGQGRKIGEFDGREREGRMVGKMNSRWQSDNPGTIDRNICRSVGVTHSAYIETPLIYRTSAMCRAGAIRMYRMYICTYGCLHKRVCDSLRTTGTHVLCMNAYTGWLDLAATFFFFLSFSRKHGNETFTCLFS